MDSHYESITKVYSRVWLKNTKNIKLIRLTNKKNQLVKAIQRIKMQALSCPRAKEEQVQELKTVLRAYNDYVKSQIMQLKEATIDYEWLFQDTSSGAHARRNCAGVWLSMRFASSTIFCAPDWCR